MSGSEALVQHACLTIVAFSLPNEIQSAKPGAVIPDESRLGVYWSWPHTAALVASNSARMYGVHRRRENGASDELTTRSAERRCPLV